MAKPPQNPQETTRINPNNPHIQGPFKGRFEELEDFPDQRLSVFPDGSFMYVRGAGNGVHANTRIIVEFFFDSNGVFTHVNRQLPSGNTQTFDRYEGRIPDPLTPEQMATAVKG